MLKTIEKRITNTVEGIKNIANQAKEYLNRVKTKKPDKNLSQNTLKALALLSPLIISGCGGTNTGLTPEQQASINKESAKIELETKCVLEKVHYYTGELPNQNIKELTQPQMEEHNLAVEELKRIENEAIQTAKKNIEEGKTDCKQQGQNIEKIKQKL